MRVTEIKLVTFQHEMLLVKHNESGLVLMDSVTRLQAGVLKVENQLGLIESANYDFVIIQQEPLVEGVLEQIRQMKSTSTGLARILTLFNPQ